MGNNFRAPNEYAWAAWLDLLGVKWKYEALEPELSRALRYQPDFWLPDALAWLEIKPAMQLQPTPGEDQVAWQLAEATGRAVYLAAGWPQSGEKLRVWIYRPRFQAVQHSAGTVALRWLVELVNRRLPDALAASRAVERRRMEFVRMWAEAQKGK